MDCAGSAGKNRTGNNTAIGFPYNRLMGFMDNTFSIDLICNPTAEPEKNRQAKRMKT